MSTSAADLEEDLEERIRSRLVDSGVRYTQGRATVVRLIDSAGGPRSAADLHGVVRDDVPLSSLYRTLMVLSDSNVLERTHGPDGVALFELSEWLRGHHHHLVCRECGSVEDIDLGPEEEIAIGSVAEKVAASKGYLARGHRLDVEGICDRCRM